MFRFDLRALRRVRRFAMAAPLALALAAAGGAWAATPALAAQAPRATPTTATPVAPAHPDDDYLGSTVRAHEQTTTTVGPRAATANAAPTATGTTTPGIDVSHYQGTVNWSGVAGNGIAFAYMKATEGVTYVDPQFATNYSGSASAGLLRGAYHFALPDVSSGTDQATYFLARGGGWVDDGHTLPPVLDIEYDPYSSNSCYNQTPAQLVAWINDFATTVHTRTNRWPVVYTTNGWWSTCTGNDITIGVNSPLWIAKPGTDPGTLPTGWTAYTFWQWGQDSTNTDQDYFNGTITQLRTFAGGTDQLEAHYQRLGGSASFLGATSGGEYPTANGWGQNYAGGTIYYQPNTGAWSVNGQILGHYQQLGGPSSFLGFPITDESGTPDGVGRYNHFANDGSIYWTSNNGAWSIHGLIRDHWSALGWEKNLGYPTTDETGTPDGVGRYNHFSNGASIYWTAGNGAWSIGGSIRAHWGSLGWERSPLGYPTTDETSTPDGVGRYNHFSAGGSIYWTAATGAWSVQGAIRDRWGSLGWERSTLGYPTSDEYGITNGRRNDFQHGYITFSLSNYTTSVYYY